MSEITAFKNALGLTHLRFKTSTGRVLDKGISMTGLVSSESKTLLFDATHRLVGFTGLASEGAVYSLGAIVLDFTCDINDPIKVVVEPEVVEPEVVEEEPFFSS